MKKQIQRDDKAYAGNIGFCASWADRITMSICNSVQLLFGLDGMLFGFLLLSSSSVFQSATVPGRRNSISQPAQSPARWWQFQKTEHSWTIGIRQ